MPVISGTTSGSIKSTALNIPCTIKSFSLYNKTGGSVSASIGVVVSGTDRYIHHSTLAAMGSTDSSFLVETNIGVPAYAQILIVASGEVDYFITID